MAQLVEAPAVQAEELAVALPPFAEGIGMHALGVEVEDDGRVLGLLAPTLLEPSVKVVAREKVLLLGLLAAQQRVADELGHGEVPHTSVGLRLLEVAERVEVVVDGEHLVVEVDVSPRQRANLAPAEPHRDGEEVADVARGLDLELVDELSHASRREGPLLLGVDFGRRHLVDGVAHDDLALNEVAEHEVEGLVDLVQVGPARRFSRKRVALAHRRVHVLDHLGRDEGDFGLADVAGDGLEAAAVAQLGVLRELAGQVAPLHEVGGALLEGGAGALPDAVVLDLLDEVAQGLLGLGVGHVLDAARAGPVLARARVEAHGDPQLPLAALGLGLVLLELDDGALADYLGHV